jgi:hypothetical protein
MGAVLVGSGPTVPSTQPVVPLLELHMLTYKVVGRSTTPQIGSTTEVENTVGFSESLFILLTLLSLYPSHDSWGKRGDLDLHLQHSIFFYVKGIIGHISWQNLLFSFFVLALIFLRSISCFGGISKIRTWTLVFLSLHQFEFPTEIWLGESREAYCSWVLVPGACYSWVLRS